MEERMMGARMITLPDNPQTMRDIVTGTNYHLESSLEALALAEKFNILAVELEQTKSYLLELEEAAVEAAKNLEIREGITEALEEAGAVDIDTPMVRNTSNG